MEIINLKQQPKIGKEFPFLFIGIVYKATWKAKEKKRSSHCSVSQHFFTWGWDQQFIVSDLQLDEEDFLHAVAILWQAGQIFNLTLEVDRSLFNNCQDKLQNVAEIISQLFPVNGEINKHWS